MTKKRVLVAPLDWGLGHATRCVPIINEFLRQGCEVQIASSGDALILLKEEFPELKFHPITSYEARYSRSMPFMVKILLQIPKFLRAISREHKEIERIVTQEKINLIISDNRYGCWLKEKRCIFISHQLNLQAPFFSLFFNSLQKWAIRRFNECWIPDLAGERSLSGSLAETSMVNIKHIGILSRLKRFPPTEVRYQIMAVISGPEPQRTIFEEKILNELKASGKKSLVVRGLPSQSGESESGNLKIVSHLHSKAMAQAIGESEIIVSRPGYSSVMDLAELGKRAIFVPTPGQSEQEYLSNYLANKKIAFSVSQDKFNLQKALTASDDYTGFQRLDENNNLLKKVIEQTLHEID